MNVKQFLGLSAVALLIASTSIPSGAQKSGMAPGTHSMGSRMSSMMHPLRRSGQIVGNKNTKVYHLPGDKGAMPDEKNRVYFRTEREARAAGYRMAGSKSGSKMNSKMGSGPHSMPMHGGRMNGHLPK